MGTGRRAVGFALGYGVTVLVALFAVRLQRRRREGRERRQVWAVCEFWFVLCCTVLMSSPFAFCLLLFWFALWYKYRHGCLLLFSSFLLLLLC